MTKRIAHVVQRMAPGGLEVLVLELSRQLPGTHYIISLEGDTDTLSAAWPRLSSCNATIVGMRKDPGIDVFLPGKLYRLLASIAPDVAITHHAGPFVYGGLAALGLALEKIIHVEHDLWHLKSTRRRLLMRNTARTVRPHIVGVSERMRAPLQIAYPGLPVSIVCNGIEIPETNAQRDVIRTRLGLDIKRTVIAAAGRLEYVKGHDILLEAFAPIAPRATLVIAGDGSQRRALEEQARKLKISDSVRFLGHRDDLSDIYPAFDIFCQPSRNEGLPLAVLEAQAHGVPVAATEVGEMATAICPRSGILVQAEDAAALSSALTTLLTRTPAPSPRIFVADRFNFSNTVAGYARLIGVN